MTRNSKTPEQHARELLNRHGFDGAERYARKMEARYFSEHWQIVGELINRYVEQARLARAAK